MYLLYYNIELAKIFLRVFSSLKLNNYLYKVKALFFSLTLYTKNILKFLRYA
ncbi:hypothetical protein ENHYDAX1_130553 [Enhydrobacter sp. AX1]|nr:hypothetical protein ENHYDAX1_130553 [Enhydrobacter sp. AX1]